MIKSLEEFGLVTSARILADPRMGDLDKLGRKIDITRVARGYTYTTRDDKHPPTSLTFEGNPFNDEILAAKNILDFGCGVGRNLPWIAENTDAMYHGLDPNPVMLKEFWNVTDKKYTDMAFLSNSFDQILGGIVFDVVVSIYVFQHIGYRTPDDVMNVTDLTQEIMKYTRKGTIWFLLEHEQEESWLDRWFTENKIEPDFFELNWSREPEMTHRGIDAHMVLWRQT